MTTFNVDRSILSHIILCGYKGSGKSYLGRLLAEELNRDFIDTDVLIEQYYQQENCIALKCREIVLEIGELHFRQLEKKIVSQLNPTRKSIIAIGGGTLLTEENHEHLKKIGILVYLKADKEILKKRIFAKGIPSFLKDLPPLQAFEEMYTSRKQLYEKKCSLEYCLEQKTTNQIIAELKNLSADL